MDTQFNCVGLFGTCGGSKWRKPYRQFLESKSIAYFDPQIMPETHGREWNSDDIKNELNHLNNDEILMFKITGETSGVLSLMELIAVVSEEITHPRSIVVLIEDLAVNHKDYSKEPTMIELANKLRNHGYTFEPIKDAERARSWIREFLNKFRELSMFAMLYVAKDDSEAMNMIAAALTYHGDLQSYKLRRNKE